MTTANPIASPSLLRRFTAMLYDSLLVIALVAVVNGLALGLMVKITEGEQELLNIAIVRLLTLGAMFSFFSVFWLKDGQTLGMQAWRVKLVRMDGCAPTLVNALLRCIAALVSAACLGLGYLWCLVDRNGYYWHDYLSGTRLILLPKRDKAGPDVVPEEPKPPTD